MAIHFELVTPEGTILTQNADEVVIPTELGEIGILPGHIPLAAAVVPGILRVLGGGKDEAIAVDRGFLYLQADALSVMVEQAVNVVAINLNESSDAQKRAEEALAKAQKNQMDEEEIQRLEAKIKYQIIKRLAKL